MHITDAIVEFVADASTRSVRSRKETTEGTP